MRTGEDLAVHVWMADVSHYVFKISNELVLKVMVMNNVNFWEQDLLFYIYASLVAFLECITPPCLSTRTFDSDCYNLI